MDNLLGRKDLLQEELINNNLVGLLSIFKVSKEEKTQLRENGYSLLSSIKDKFRLFLQFLAQNTKEQGFGVKELQYCLQNWSNFIKLLSRNSDLSNLNEKERQLYICFSESYWQTYSQIQEDIITQLKETKEFDLSLLNETNGIEEDLLIKLRSFSQQNSLRQRVFEYTLDKTTHQNMIISAIRCFEAKRNDREFIELQNLVKLYQLSYTDDFLMNCLQRYPEIEIQAHDCNKGNIVVEFSPPIYSHQKDIMVRFYERTNKGWRVKILSLPYSKDNLRKDIAFLRHLGKKNGGNVFVEDARNKILSETFIIENELFINQLEQVKSVGGLQVIALNDEIIAPKLQEIKTKVEPFVIETLSKLPEIVSTPESLANSARRYQEVLNAARLAYMPKVEGISSDDQQLINSGLIEEVISGVSVNDFISAQTDIGKNGENVVIGGSSECGMEEIQLKREEGAQKEVTKSLNDQATSGLFGNNMEKIIGKNGEVLSFFDKKNSRTGKVERHILCPVCEKGSIDVCDLGSKCPVCNTVGHQMKDAYDKGVLNDLKIKKSTKLVQSTTTSAQQELQPNESINNFLDGLISFKWLLP